ncbi:MFS transporter small subunit [Methylomonas sp. LL1]
MNHQQKTSVVTLMLFWLYVAMPLLWGVASTIKKAMALFG